MEQPLLTNCLGVKGATQKRLHTLGLELTPHGGVESRSTPQQLYVGGVSTSQRRC